MALKTDCAETIKSQANLLYKFTVKVEVKVNHVNDIKQKLNISVV